MVKFLPEGDRYSMKYIEFTSQLTVAMGGRVAEEIIFGKEHITTGAGSDIQQATSWARRMVTEFGFSEKLGPLRYNEDSGEVFLGREVGGTPAHSDEVASKIDRVCAAAIPAVSSALASCWTSSTRLNPLCGDGQFNRISATTPLPELMVTVRSLRLRMRESPGRTGAGKRALRIPGAEPAIRSARSISIAAGRMGLPGK